MHTFLIYWSQYFVLKRQIFVFGVQIVHAQLTLSLSLIQHEECSPNK